MRQCPTHDTQKFFYFPITFGRESGKTSGRLEYNYVHTQDKAYHQPSEQIPKGRDPSTRK